MTRLPRSRFLLWAIATSLVLANLSGTVMAGGEPHEPTSNTPIEHLIVLMQENHTFDNYFGTYPRGWYTS